MPDRPHTRTPKLQVPSGACDTHMHIYNSAYPASSKAWLFPPDFSVDDYRKMQARLGLRRTIIVQPVTYGFDNSCTLDALSTLGASARAIAVVDTSVTDAEVTLEDVFLSVVGGGAKPITPPTEATVS